MPGVDEVMKKQALVTSLSLIVAVGAWARQSEPVDSAAIAKIRDEGMNRSQTSAMFNVLVDDIGPRLTGSPAHKRSADWAKDQLTKWGLANPRLEAWEF